MNPDLRQRLEPLFHAALEIPEEERATFVSKACGDDDQAREELAALLNAHVDHTTVGDSPIQRLRKMFPTKTEPFFVGAVVEKRFRIVRHIGAGGMGDVYEATDLQLGRVALKTIRADIASPDMLSRFRRRSRSHGR